MLSGLPYAFAADDSKITEGYTAHSTDHSPSSNRHFLAHLWLEVLSLWSQSVLLSHSDAIQRHNSQCALLVVLVHNNSVKD